MQIQILARGDGAKDGWFRMKDLNVIPYNQLVLLDQVMLAEHTDSSDFFYASATEAKLNYQRTGSMSREFSLVNPQRERLLINEIESPNPLWEFRLDTDKSRARLDVNGVTSGFITTGSGEGQIVVILEKMYRVGIALLLLGTLVGVICVLPWRWRKKKSYKTYL